MFFFKRKRTILIARAAVEAATKAYTHSPIRREPENFWAEPFVMGYIGGMSNCYARGIIGEHVSSTEIRQITMRVHTDLSAAPRHLVESTFLKFVAHSYPEFNRGIHAAIKVFAFAHRLLKDEDSDNDVKNAIKIASLGLSRGRTPDREDVCGALQSMLFDEGVRRSVPSA